MGMYGFPRRGNHQNWRADPLINHQNCEMTNDQINALDYYREGQWDKAHQLIQSFTDRNSCLIHGYLHRVEGDPNNARYWYNRVGEDMPDNTLEEELSRLYELVRSC